MIFFFFYSYGSHRDPHSFPTRRSSDLLGQLLEAKQRQTERSRTQPGAAGAPGTTPAGGGETKILVDQRTNSLLVMALPEDIDRKSTRLNSSHVEISYAVFCLKKKKDFF